MDTLQRYQREGGVPNKRQYGLKEVNRAEGGETAWTRWGGVLGKSMGEKGSSDWAESEKCLLGSNKMKGGRVVAIPVMGIDRDL